MSGLADCDDEIVLILGLARRAVPGTTGYGPARVFQCGPSDVRSTVFLIQPSRVFGRVRNSSHSIFPRALWRDGSSSTTMARLARPDGNFRGIRQAPGPRRAARTPEPIHFCTGRGAWPVSIAPEAQRVTLSARGRGPLPGPDGPRAGNSRTLPARHIDHRAGFGLQIRRP